MHIKFVVIQTVIYSSSKAPSCSCQDPSAESQEERETTRVVGKPSVQCMHDDVLKTLGGEQKQIRRLE